MKKKIIIALFVSLVFPPLVKAHEEPAKTLKEKKDKEEKRLKIKSQNLRSQTIWKYEVKEGIADTRSKQKFLVTEYSKEGNIAAMILYKSGDSLEAKTMFTYDDDNNMITDTDYNPDGSMVDSIVYQYDDRGRVISESNYNPDGSLNSEFIWVRKNPNEIIMTDISLNDSITNWYIYTYSGHPDSSDVIEIEQKDKYGDPVMYVENVFSHTGLRTHKKIRDARGDLMYYFEYAYMERTKLTAFIEKKSPEGQRLSKTVYSYGIYELVTSFESFDGDDKLMSSGEYTYTSY